MCVLWKLNIPHIIAMMYCFSLCQDWSDLVDILHYYGTLRSIAKMDRKYRNLELMISIFSMSSFEVYLTDQFIRLSAWVFRPHTILIGLLHRFVRVLF